MDIDMHAVDAFINESTRPQSYMEYIVKMEQGTPNAWATEQALYAMDQLEGWCSKEKAVILMDLIFNNKPQTVVEIGVFGGKSLVPMAFALKQNGSGKVYGIDPWDSLRSAEGMEGVNKDYWGTLDHLAILNGLVAKIKQFDLSKQVVLIKSTSEGADPIANIDMLHIDGNHSEPTSFLDVKKWVPLVKQGGIIIFDDITWGTTGRAVKWLDECCIRLSEHKGDNEWAIWYKP